LFFPGARSWYRVFVSVQGAEIVLPSLVWAKVSTLAGRRMGMERNRLKVMVKDLASHGAALAAVGTIAVGGCGGAPQTPTPTEMPTAPADHKVAAGDVKDPNGEAGLVLKVADWCESDGGSGCICCGGTNGTVCDAYGSCPGRPLVAAGVARVAGVEERDDWAA
jgi:hypothetical protein